MAKPKYHSYVKYPISELRENKDMREICFAELILHLQEGYSIDCFGPISSDTIFELCKDYPDEFNPVALEIVVRKAKTGWEKIGREQAEGKCLGNSRAWFYNMAHRYGWSDKVDIKADIKGSVSVNVINYNSDQA